jgi:class 3 adenylate cyclase
VRASEDHAPRSYTPRHLAEKILTSRAALEGERKHVTVFFADIKDSMQLAAELGPEAWHRILDRFFEILTSGVHRFEGTINQYTGDGIMALFGAPIAHEDHAQRACYAALHLRDRLRDFADELRSRSGISFGVRIGLNSGDVVVGKIGDDLRMDYTAQGHTVGLAQRVEQIAEPGRICLSDDTRRLVEDFFSLRDLGAFSLKGVSRDVRIHELERTRRLRTRLEVAQAHGLTRFVGREAETQALEAALDEAQRGHARVVSVIGEAGVGKSRLCLEFLGRCRDRGIAIREAHCPPYGKNVPFLAVLELFRSFFGLAEHDTSGEARRTIRAALLRLDPKFREVLPLVFAFLGLGDPTDPALASDPEVRERQFLDFVEQVVRARSAREAAVIMIDDLQWADPASDAFIGKLVDGVIGTRTLILLASRPEYRPKWQRRSHCLELRLSPLDPAALRSLAESLLGSDPSLGDVIKRVDQWTGGNPFFAEEVIKTFIEDGQIEGNRGSYRLTGDLEGVGLPSTVHDLVAARIDRLPDSAKHLLQTAATIGKEFPGPLLEDVTELPEYDRKFALDRLRDDDFIFERTLYPVALYAFTHPILYEVAYESQLEGWRADAHARVARAIEQQDADRLSARAKPRTLPYGTNAPGSQR